MSFNISTNPKITASWDTINSPQAYSQRPLAAAYVKDAYYIEEPKKNSPLKSFFKAAAFVAVVGGGLALARTKINALKAVNVENASLYKGKDKIKFYIAKAGQMVIDGVKALKFWGKKAGSEAEKATSKTSAPDAN